jgi:hypothetical protein
MRIMHPLLTILLIGPVTLLGCEPFAFDSPHQSDRALILNFEDHAAQFVELVKMSNEDPKVIRIAQDYTRLEDNWNWPRPETQWGITGPRWDEYRRLFTKLGLTGGLDRVAEPKGTIVYLIAFSMGIVNRGISKGYAYSETEVSPLVDSLDKRPNEMRGTRRTVLSIER